MTIFDDLKGFEKLLNSLSPFEMTDKIRSLMAKNLANALAAAALPSTDIPNSYVFKAASAALKYVKLEVTFKGVVISAPPEHSNIFILLEKGSLQFRPIPDILPRLLS